MKTLVLILSLFLLAGVSCTKKQGNKPKNESKPPHKIMDLNSRRAFVNELLADFEKTIETYKSGSVYGKYVASKIISISLAKMDDAQKKMTINKHKESIDSSRLYAWNENRKLNNFLVNMPQDLKKKLTDSSGHQNVLRFGVAEDLTPEKCKEEDMDAYFTKELLEKYRNPGFSRLMTLIGSFFTGAQIEARRALPSVVLSSKAPEKDEMLALSLAVIDFPESVVRSHGKGFMSMALEDSFKKTAKRIGKTRKELDQLLLEFHDQLPDCLAKNNASYYDALEKAEKKFGFE